jgi:hypothetical protein
MTFDAQTGLGAYQLGTQDATTDQISFVDSTGTGVDLTVAVNAIASTTVPVTGGAGASASGGQVVAVKKSSSGCSLGAGAGSVAALWPLGLLVGAVVFMKRLVRRREAR